MKVRGLKGLKPLYLTTPIFYVNAKPHVGHLYSMLFADIRARWETLNPKKSVFVTTGTDEHGLKIQNVALKQNIPPKELCDIHSMEFKKLASLSGVDYNRFIRTTDEDHILTVKKLWNFLYEKDLIYKDSHNGWYSVNDEAFVPENQIEEVDGRKISKESKHEVVYQSETNYFFKLSKFQDQLIGYIEKNPDFIIPKNKYDEILKELKLQPLKDLSISRPSSRLNWGIEVPNDSEQRIYVWFDALINYLTVCSPVFGQKISFPDTDIWPPTQVIGKDISRFHCVYWPIILMASGISLPEQIVVHSHWLNDGFKMSKSLGNVVDPVDVIGKYSVDVIRYFLMQNSNLSNDSNYSDYQLVSTANNLTNKFGNLVTRIGSPNFSIEDSVNMFNQGQFTDVDDIIGESNASLLQVRDELLDGLDKLPYSMDKHFKDFEFLKAVSEWFKIIELANQFVTIAEPWKLKEEKDLKFKNYVILVASETVRICTILIEPIMPNVSKRILDRLNVNPENRNVFHVKPFEEINYGEGANEKGAEKPFEKLEKA